MPIESIIAKKSLGVLMHPTCIPGGRVCGTFGRGAKEWIKKLHKHGIEYWQFLPLAPTDSTGSPYSSPSANLLDIRGTFSIPKYDAISSANLGFVVPLTSLNLLLVRLKFDSLLCIAVIKLVTKFAP